MESRAAISAPAPSVALRPSVPGALLSRRHQFLWLFPVAAFSWFLGLGAFIFPIIALFLFISFVQRRNFAVPRSFAIWLLFLAWIPLSAAELAGAGEGLVFLQRYFGILAASIFFVYVFNSSRKALSDQTVVNALATYWGILVVGGLIAAFFPYVQYHSPMEHILPRPWLANDYLYGTVHVSFADVQSFLGFPVGRPRIFTTAANAWGSLTAILTPFAFAARSMTRSIGRRRVLEILLAISPIPIVFSLNRGMWLALVIAGGYVIVRSAVLRNARLLAWSGVAASAFALAIVTTPLGTLVSDRLAHPHSNTTRERLYHETIAGIKKQPYFGYGGPRASEHEFTPHLGTHSEILFTMYAYGIPAFLFYFFWIALTFFRSLRFKSPAILAANVAMLIFLVESPYYLLQSHLIVVLIAGALIWRTIVDNPRTRRLFMTKAY